LRDRNIWKKFSLFVGLNEVKGTWLSLADSGRNIFEGPKGLISAAQKTCSDDFTRFFSIRVNND
jgi:hypothetical protein